MTARTTTLPSSSRRHCSAAAGAILVLLVGGCAVGPDYVRPPAPKVSGYTPSETATLPAAGEVEQRLVLGHAVTAQWWRVFQSSKLEQVLQLAIAGSPSLEAARATLAQAQQAVIQARGGLYPQIDASASARRQRAGASGLGGLNSSGFVSSRSLTNLYSVGATASYAPDVFGGVRRGIEQQESLAENQRYQLAAAYLTLTGNAVTQAIDIATARMQISAVEAIIADDEKNLSLVETKYQAGKAARSDVLTAESQLATDRTQLAPLKQQLSAARHALAILAGQFPAAWSPPDFDIGEFTLPSELPVSLPSDLVRQRPDILAAEAQLHASSAAIGVAAAQLYPSITLSGSLGLESLSTSTLFQASSRFWSIAADLSAPLFHGNALEAQRQAAVEAFRATAATYQQVVLQAFGQVADLLRALEYDAELVAAQKSALDTSTASLEMQRASYDAGKSNILQLLDAERSQQQARLGYARAQAQRFQDTAQLFVAMGGGWWGDERLFPAAPLESQTAHP